jgi:hypothetical protein
VRVLWSGFSRTLRGEYATPKYIRRFRSKLTWNTRPRASRVQPNGASARPARIV